MFVKSYGDVTPTLPAEVTGTVQLREMITGRDGAPNFALRVFDLQPGSSTPFHAHPWEHEVFIVQGGGHLRGKDRELAFKAGDSVFVPPGETHCFAADAGTAVQFICVIPNPSPDACR